jgi:glyceraldehyde 3-phosphate dehydrogenase
MAFTVNKAATKEGVLEVLERAASSKRLQGILTVSQDPCVSIDFQTDPHSSIIDAPSTKVVGEHAIQLLSWYDNEWGYAMRVTEMTLALGAFLRTPSPI